MLLQHQRRLFLFRLMLLVSKSVSPCWCTHTLLPQCIPAAILSLRSPRIRIGHLQCRIFAKPAIRRSTPRARRVISRNRIVWDCLMGSLVTPVQIMPLCPWDWRDWSIQNAW